MTKPQNKVQLITYPDSLGGDLKGLYSILKNNFADVVHSVHILPYYPSSADRGFSTITHGEVASEFGTWEDIQKIADDFELMSDLMVNHISSKSLQFQDYLKNGEGSEYADWFVSSEKFSRRIRGRMRDFFGDSIKKIEKVVNFFRRHDILFHKDGVNRLVLREIYRPRPGSPFVRFSFQNGEEKELWCSFSDDQIDLDINNPGVRKVLQNTIELLAEKGTKGIRLDAVGYVGKRRGTSNFMIPETCQFIEWLAGVAHQQEMYVLPEIHHNYQLQIELSKMKGVDYIYDFALPMLVLHSIFSGDAEKLKNWIRLRPHNQITTLDTHDGIGVIDVEDLMSQGEIDEVIKMLRNNGGNATMRASGVNSENLDIYQKNITFYSALGEDDRKYLLARAIQFFVPGIPQVFYVGLLAGENDVQRLEETGVGREIMRHGYTAEEVQEEMKRKVVSDLFELIKFRNSHPAFDGIFGLEESADHILHCKWEKEDSFCELKADLEQGSAVIRYNDEDPNEVNVYRVC